MVDSNLKTINGGMHFDYSRPQVWSGRRWVGQGTGQSIAQPTDVPLWAQGVGQAIQTPTPQAMHYYAVQPGDTPGIIAEKFTGNPGRLGELIAANGHKTGQVVDGNVTFKNLTVGEDLIVPAGWMAKLPAVQHAQKYPEYPPPPPHGVGQPPPPAPPPPGCTLVGYYTATTVEHGVFSSSTTGFTASNGAVLALPSSVQNAAFSLTGSIGNTTVDDYFLVSSYVPVGTDVGVRVMVYRCPPPPPPPPPMTAPTSVMAPQVARQPLTEVWTPSPAHHGYITPPGLSPQHAAKPGLHGVPVRGLGAPSAGTAAAANTLLALLNNPASAGCGSNATVQAFQAAFNADVAADLIVGGIALKANGLYGDDTATAMALVLPGQPLPQQPLLWQTGGACAIAAAQAPAGGAPATVPIGASNPAASNPTNSAGGGTDNTPYIVGGVLVVAALGGVAAYMIHRKSMTGGAKRQRR